MNRKLSLLCAGIFVTLAILLAVPFVGSGFQKRTDVVLTRFSVSEDGNTVTVDTSVTGSMGYTRDIKLKQYGNRIYATFYGTFGGLNSRIGARHSFDIETGPDCEAIYFYRGPDGYSPVMEKNPTIDRWVKVQN